VGRNNPLRHSNSVDFPDPFGPSRIAISPDFNVMSRGVKT
jgi:hypothetical protein